MSKLWPIRTWVADEKDGVVSMVSRISQMAPFGPAGMDLQEYGYDYAVDWRPSKDGFVEIPPKPDEEALRKQGYRLTGIAADCSKQADGRLHVATNGQVVESAVVFIVAYNGWRWLVERIEEERLEDQLAKDAADDHFAEEGKHGHSSETTAEYKAGYDAGWAACRDNAIRILSSRKEHDYE